MKKLLLFIFVINVKLFVFAQSNKFSNEVAWLNKNIIPISALYAGSGFKDLKPFGELVADARIVSLGECTHGSSEIFSMKHRLLEYLVIEKGFTIFSIEANMPEAYALNEFVLHGKGDPKKLISGMYFWTWYTQEVLDMVLWMKKYNETGESKIMFTGFDMQFPEEASSITRQYLTKEKGSLLPLLDNYDSIVRANRKNKDYQKTMYPELKNVAKILLDSMANISHNNDDTAFVWAYQNTKILWQHGAGLNNNPARDESMAENIKWIVHQNPTSKIVLWAHNGHIRKSTDKFGTKMGEYLYKEFGNKMVVIGFTTNEGTYTAATRKSGKFSGIDSSNLLVVDKKGSFENIFRNATSPNFILDLRNRETDEGAKWLLEPNLFRYIGALVTDKFQFIDTDITQKFDIIVFLRKTSSSKCFSIGEKKVE